MDPVNIPAKFEVRSFICSWDNMGYWKIWADPGYAHAPFSPKFLKDFCWDGPCEYTWQIWSCSFIRSWDNRGYSKNLGSPWIRRRSLFFQISKGLLFAWILWIHLPNLKLAAVPIPETIGGTQKNLGRPWIRPRSLFSEIFQGLCSDGPCECIGQICSP